MEASRIEGWLWGTPPGLGCGGCTTHVRCMYLNLHPAAFTPPTWAALRIRLDASSHVAFQSLTPPPPGRDRLSSPCEHSRCKGHVAEGDG